MDAVIEIEHIIPVEHDCTQNVSFSEALDIVLQEDDWVAHLPSTVSPYDIASLITFGNSHLVAHALTSNPEATRALYEELSYWVNNTNI